MRRADVIGAAILSLLLGTAALAYAQHEEQGHEQQGHEQHQPGQGAQQQHQQSSQQQHQQSAPHQQQAGRPESHQQQANRPAPHQPDLQPSYGSTYHGGVRSDGPTYGGVHHSGVPQHQGQVREGILQSRANSWNHDHQSWKQRGGYSGYRVPQDRFRLYFGSGHAFRIYGLPMMFVGGYPRFQYDGYWVTFVDPWPESWSPTWYETDDVYLDYSDDGYYVYNRMHPGPGIAVTIAF